MIDPELINIDLDGLIKKISTRSGNFEYLGKLKQLVQTRKECIMKEQTLNQEKNIKSKEVGSLMAQKRSEEAERIKQEVLELKKSIEENSKRLEEIQSEFENILLMTPNVPRGTIPVGKDENANKEVRKLLTPRSFDFEPKAHWDILQELNLLDFERSTKISGARFVTYKNQAAELVRALAAFMLDFHKERGYTEVLPSVVVNAKSLTGTGNLPKFEEDLFKLTNNMYLSPTSEVQLTNLYADEIIDGKELPIKQTAYTYCFRSEAGSAGRDTRGIIRMHQFNKVEMVNITRPEDSDKTLEEMVKSASDIMTLLELPHRVILLCTGDMGFSSEMTYDLEVWLPSYNSYKEISSCSNCGTFQARRAKIRYKDDIKDKAQFVHTLNGSGLAIDRTIAAILENHQNPDGSVNIPRALQRYMGGRKLILKK